MCPIVCCYSCCAQPQLRPDVPIAGGEPAVPDTALFSDGRLGAQHVPRLLPGLQPCVGSANQPQVKRGGSCVLAAQSQVERGGPSLPEEEPAVIFLRGSAARRGPAVRTSLPASRGLASCRGLTASRGLTDLRDLAAYWGLDAARGRYPAAAPRPTTTGG